MQKFKTIILWFMLILISNSLFAELTKESLDTQRTIFIRAEQALKNNDKENYERLRQQITTYPLYPYLTYEELKQKISTNASGIAQQLNAFEKTYPDFPFIQNLRNTWLLKLAQSKNWSTFIKEYRPTKNNEELQCYYYYGKHQVSHDNTWLEKAKPLWLVGSSQPAACDILFAAWQKAGGLTHSLVWERIQLALENKEFKLALHLSKKLPKSEQHTVALWEKILKNPELLTKEKTLSQINAPHKVKKQIVAHGLKSLARKNGELALRWWEAHQKDFAFSPQQTAQIKRDIGVYLSHQRSPMASDWLKALPEETLDSIAKEWRIRLALANKSWWSVLKWINHLPSEQKQEDCWQYWRARALEGVGRTEDASSIYQRLSKQRSYYGFLASIRRQESISLKQQGLQPDPMLIKKISSLPSTQRFEQLLLLNREAIARVEWFRAAEKMNEKELLAAAKIAQKLHLHDIAIFTVAKSQHKDDLRLRFPLGFKKDIVTHANKNSLDPAWVFAVTRQESAFFTQAISTAGARGLMQIRHTTAQMLSQKHAIPYASETALHEPPVNIEIGTVYLKNLKDRMKNHAILATASYNAGPERIMHWLPEKAQEADIWVETIPYKETREYVKNVVTFTGIYRHHLGYSSSGISLLMKPIPAKEVFKS